MNIMKLSKLCRVCLNTSGNNIEMQSALDEEISLKLKLCGGIIVDNETIQDYPNLICNHCYEKLDVAYNFRLTCENTQRTLENLILDFQSNSLVHNNLQMFHDIKPSIPDTSDLISKIKIELTPDHKEAGSLDKIIFQDNEYEVQQLGSFNEDDEIVNDVEHLEKNDLRRKYTKENIFKPDSETSRKVEKRKYTKKESTVNIKNSKEDSKYVCEFCNLEYKGKSSFTYHMRRHTNELNYVCEICGTAFETNFKLKRHTLKHMGTLPYSCRSCDMKFSSSSNRDRHERRLHTTIRPFQCIYCIKAFSYSDQLKNHIRVHTGEKPYVCEKCGSAFKRKGHLSAHANALTPCVIKMTLKNKIVNEKNKLHKTLNKTAIKNKNSKSILKKKTNISDNKNLKPTTEHLQIETLNDIVSEDNKISVDYINDDDFNSDSIVRKENISSECTIIAEYENEEHLHFYNLETEENDT